MFQKNSIKKHLVFKDRSKDTRGRSIGSVILPIPAGIGDAMQCHGVVIV